MSYDQEFAEAMKLKLELNRQARDSQTSEASYQGVDLDLREQAIAKTLDRHPGLTRERVLKGMQEMGF